MKKTLSILLLILMVVILGGCKLLQKKEAPAEGGVAKEESYIGNLQKMMGLGIPLKCEWKKDEKYFGNSWVKGKNSYGEVHMENKTAKVIFKDNCLWSWEEGNPQGFKMCFEPEEVKEGLPEEEEWGEMGKMQPPDIDYNCRPAVFTDAKFNPPGNVQFMTMEEMMQGGGGMAPQGGSMPEMPEMPEGMPELPEGLGQ